MHVCSDTRGTILRSYIARVHKRCRSSNFHHYTVTENHHHIGNNLVGIVLSSVRYERLTAQCMYIISV